MAAPSINLFALFIPLVLKEIANICSINKKLTTHTARHTFATTVTLGNDDMNALKSKIQSGIKEQLKAV